MTGPESTRAQSEVTGIAFLTGVVATVGLIVGVVLVTQAGGGDAGPTTDVRLDVSTDSLTLTHNGGERIERADLRLTLRQGGSQRRAVPSAANLSGPDDRFDPGDRIERDHDFDPGAARVVLVHDPSNTVITSDTVDVPA